MINSIVGRLAILVGIIFCASAAIHSGSSGRFDGESIWMIVFGIISIFVGLMVAGRR